MRAFAVVVLKVICRLMVYVPQPKGGELVDALLQQRLDLPFHVIFAEGRRTGAFSASVASPSLTSLFWAAIDCLGNPASLTFPGHESRSQVVRFQSASARSSGLRQFDSGRLA